MVFMPNVTRLRYGLMRFGSCLSLGLKGLVPIPDDVSVNEHVATPSRSLTRKPCYAGRSARWRCKCHAVCRHLSHYVSVSLVRVQLLFCVKTASEMTYAVGWGVKLCSIQTNLAPRKLLMTVN